MDILSCCLLCHTADARENRLTRLPALPARSTLKMLFLARNALAELPAAALAGMDNLIQLDLRENQACRPKNRGRTPSPEFTRSVVAQGQIWRQDALEDFLMHDCGVATQ